MSYTSSKAIHSALGIVLGTALGVSAFAVPSFAAGGGTTPATTPTCKNKMVWDKAKKKCVKAKKSSGLSDDNLFEAARDLAYNQRYQEAIDVLKLADNQDDPRILNYLGYSNRKLGRVEKGLTYYKTALKFDPDYTLVMEYMGEAFLQLDQVDKAQEQLAEIEKRCGKDCREYAMLEKRIAEHLAR